MEILCSENGNSACTIWQNGFSVVCCAKLGIRHDLTDHGIRQGLLSGVSYRKEILPLAQIDINYSWMHASVYTSITYKLNVYKYNIFWSTYFHNLQQEKKKQRGYNGNVYLTSSAVVTSIMIIGYRKSPFQAPVYSF